MKRISLLFSIFSSLGAATLPVLGSGNSPAFAQTSGCGTGSSWYLLRTLTPVSVQQFNPACQEHDACYDTFGESKQDCDNQFRKRMLGICARDHKTIVQKPLQIQCNNRANAFYQGVVKGGQEAYNTSQAKARPRPTTVTLPTTVIDLPSVPSSTSTNSSPPTNSSTTTNVYRTSSGEECVGVTAQKGWQYFNLSKPRSRITYVKGRWSVDPNNYVFVGAEGHSGDDAKKLEPYNQYKYDQNFLFGALIVDIPTDGYGYIQVSAPQSLPRLITRTALRINDADNALGDNAGGVAVCFGD